jgi:hypothetical protein
MGVTASKSAAVDPVIDVSASVVAVVDVSAAPVVQDVSAAPVDVSSSVVEDVSASETPIAPVSGSEIKKSRSCGLCCSKDAVAVATSEKTDAVVSQSPEQTSEKNPEPTAV